MGARVRSILDLHPLLQLHRHGSSRPARHPTCARWLINRPLDTAPGGLGAWGPHADSSEHLSLHHSLFALSPVSFPGYLSVGFSDALHILPVLPPPGTPSGLPVLMTEDSGKEVLEGVVKSQKPKAPVSTPGVTKLSAKSLGNPSASLCPPRCAPTPPVQVIIVLYLGGCGSLPSGLPASILSLEPKLAEASLFSQS